MKKFLKPIIAFLLSSIMTMQIMPLSAFAEIVQGNQPELLDYEIPEDENENSISLATISTDVDEGKKYILTIARSNSNGAAEVTLKTIDLSAKYGEDYIISDTDYKTDIIEADKTILEQSADIEEQLNRYEEIKQTVKDTVVSGDSLEIQEDSLAEDAFVDMEALTEENEGFEDIEEAEETNEVITEEVKSEEKSDFVKAEETDDKIEESEENENTSNVTIATEVSTEEKEETLEEIAERTGKSSLAILKEQQTGRATRQTSETEFTPIENVFMQQIQNDFGDAIDASSLTKVVFKDGESTKQIVVDVLDDDISEGTEIVDFIISDASEGWNISKKMNCTLTINDDEPVVHSVISFSEEEYNAENGSAVIKITRTGAEYSLVTAMVRSIEDGSAKTGENFSMVNTAIELAPYKNEQIITIPVYTKDKNKDFTLELYDVKGADIGSVQRCKVNIIAPEKYSESNDDSLELLSDDNRISFDINLNGKTYTVKYYDGDKYGDIYDTNYNDVVVGKYYFPYPSGVNGGQFEYNRYNGDSHKNVKRESKYVRKGEEDTTNRTGAGYAYWYSSLIGRQGSSNFYSESINTVPYQYFSADWEQSSSFGSKHYVEMVFEQNSSAYIENTVGVSGKFSRQMSNPLVLVSGNNTAVEKNQKIKFLARDKEGGKAPKIELYVYGVAAMYRRFKIDLIQPDALEFKDERVAGTGKKNISPATVTLGAGHSTRYAGQNLEVVVNNNSNGNILGTIKEYKITVYKSNKETATFTYKPSSDNNSIKNISFDDNFIKQINKVVGNNNYAFNSDGIGYYTQLKIQPVFEYIDVKVDINNSDYGEFSSTLLKNGNTYHIGDTFSMAGKTYEQYANSLEYVGYNKKAYTDDSNTTPTEHCDVYKTNNDGNDLFLMLLEKKYILKPNFSDENFIGIKLTDKAKQYLTVTNGASAEKISGEIKNRLNSLKIDYVLITNDSALSKATFSDNDLKPTSSKAYTIEVKSNNSNYRPVYTMSKNSNLHVVGSCLDYIAESISTDNIITIDVEMVNTSKEKNFAISGYTMMPGSTIRNDGTKIDDDTAIGVNVTAGSEFATYTDKDSGKKSYYLKRKSALSDNDGKFQINGIKALDGDVISVKLSNGDIEQVEYIKLNSNGLNLTDIQYTEIINGEDTPVTKKGYVFNIGSVYMPIRSALVPYVNSITYTAEQISGYVIEVSKNEIPIISTYIEVTANLTLNGRQAKAVIFTRVSKNGSKEETRVKSTAYNQREFTARYKLDTTFEDGDMLYVSVVDNEDRTMSVNYCDEETGEIKSTMSTEERIYTSIYTGLSFYVPSVEVKPQTLEFENSTSVNIPLLGDVASSLSTGSLSFNKTYTSGAEGDANRSYTLGFYFAPGYSTMSSVPAGSVLSNVKKGMDVASSQLKTSPEAEEASLSSEIANLFGVSRDDTISVFDKEYSSLALQKSLANITKATPFDVHMLVLLSFDFVYDNETNQYVMTSGQYLIGGMFTVAKCIYTTIYGLPVYLKLSGSFGMNFSGNYATDNKNVITQNNFTESSNIYDLIDDKVYATVTLGGSAAVGVGLSGVLGASGIVNVNIAAKNGMYTNKNGNVSGGFLFKLGGGFGIDLLLFSINYVPSILTYGSGCYANLSDGIVTLSDDTGSVLRLMNTGSSDMSSFGNSLSLLSSEQTPVSSKVLLENARERTSPQITTLSDGRKFMVFMANDGSGNNINSTTVMYTVADKNGSWSTPKPVDDNGTADALPQLVKYNDNVVIVWSDLNKQFDTNSNASEVLSSFELAYKVYNSKTGELSEKTVITNDDYMDTGASFYIDEETNQLCCYYIKRDIKQAKTNEELVDVSATYSTLAKKKYDINSSQWETEEVYLDILHDRIIDPLIIDFSSVKTTFDGKQYVWMTYTIDEDENLNTVDDRNVYLILENVTDSLVHYPIAMTNNTNSNIKPKFTKFNDSVYLSWIEAGSKLHNVNLTDVFEEMKNDNLFDLYMGDIEKDWYKKSAQDLGISEEEYDNSIYEKLAEGNLSGTAKDFASNEYIDRSIGDYQIYNDNDKNLYVFWTETGSIDASDGNSNGNVTELYGATYINALDELGVDSYSGWGEPIKITNLGKTINEFSITFDDNENMSMVSNLFEQKINDEGKLEVSANKLVEIDFSRDCSIVIDDELEFDKVPFDGKEVNVSFKIKNDGLITSDGYTLCVKQVNGSESQVIYTKDNDIQLISGLADEYNIPWNVSGDTNGMKLVIEATDKTTGKTVSLEKVVEQKAVIDVENKEVKFDKAGKLFISADITNNGNIESGEITLEAYDNIGDGTVGNKYGDYSIGRLKAGETVSVEYELESYKAYESLSKYGLDDILQRVIIDGNEVNSSVLTAIAFGVVDIMLDNASEVSLNKGESYEINASVVPSNVADKTISYTSSDTNVVNVTNEGKIVPVGNGVAIVTIEHLKSGITKEIKVNSSGFVESDTEVTTETTTIKDDNNNSYGNSSGGKSSYNASTQTIKEADEEETVENAENKITPFTDVSNNAWFADSVKYVYENNIFNGITDNLFAPNMNTTRGMLVTVLGRMENVDTNKFADKSAYSDVNLDMYYTPYIEWATENNIVAGFGDGSFKPDENVTREQLARIIANYMTYKGKNVDISSTALPFEDSEEIADWAIDSAKYCYERGVIKGDNKNMFNPNNNATRAELATIIMQIGA